MENVPAQAHLLACPLLQWLRITCLLPKKVKEKKKQTEKVQSKENLSHQIFFTLCKKPAGSSLSLVRAIPLEFSAAFSLTISYRGGRKIQAPSQVKSRPFACLTSAVGIRFDVLHTPLWSLRVLIFFFFTMQIIKLKKFTMR